MQRTIETASGPVSAAVSGGGPAVLVLAHGAGGTLDQRQLVLFAGALESFAIATVRFNFPYVERGRRSPGSPKESISAYRSVTEAVRGEFDRVFVGGKSYGGRMASHAVAEGMDAEGLVFLGYPLHAPATPERLRDEHLSEIKVPMLFLQGTRDAFARYEAMRKVVARLPLSTLHTVEDADHSFVVRGRKSIEVTEELARVTASWIDST